MTTGEKRSYCRVTIRGQWCRHDKSLPLSLALLRSDCSTRSRRGRSATPVREFLTQGFLFEEEKRQQHIHASSSMEEWINNHGTLRCLFQQRLLHEFHFIPLCVHFFRAELNKNPSELDDSFLWYSLIILWCRLLLFLLTLTVTCLQLAIKIL